MALVNLDVPHTGVHRLSRRFLEPAQDLLVLGIARNQAFRRTP
ncbi:MAG TPA: hypothetical protein VF493_19260 [Terriglobales bacterium]